MSKNRRLRRVLDTYSDKKQGTIKVFSGSLGIIKNNEQVVEVNGRPGFVWVRLRTVSNEIIQAHNDKVSPVYGLPVNVSRQKGNNNYYTVIGRNVDAYGGIWGNSSSYLPRHGQQHSFDKTNPESGGDIVWTYPDQFTPFLVFPSGSSGAGNVLIHRGIYSYDDEIRYAGDTGSANILTYKPTDNQARMVLLYMNEPTGNFHIATGTSSDFSATLTGTNEVIQYLPSLPVNGVALAGIRLLSGTSSINWGNIYDVRKFLFAAETSATTSSGTINVLDNGVFEGVASNLDFTSNIFVEFSGNTATILTSGTGGGTSNHNELANLGWEASNHTGSISNLAGFDTGGNADDVSVGAGLQLVGSELSVTGSFSGISNHAELDNLGWENSNHTGSATALAGFDGSSIADVVSIGSGLQLSGSTLSALLTGTADGNAIHDNVADEIHQVAEKSLPSGSDVLLIEDSADTWNKKRITISSITGTSGGGGISNHADLDNLGWEISNHTGSASNLAGFDTAGNADDISLGHGLDLSGSNLSVDITGTVDVYDNTVFVGSPRRLDFRDALSAELSGDIVYVDFTGTSSGISVITGTIAVYDNGVFEGEARELDFTNNIFVEFAGNTATILVSGTGGAGTSNHTELSNLGWEVSNHTGSVSNLAGFDNVGNADNIQVGAGLELSGSILSVTGTFGNAEDHSLLDNLGWESSNHTGTVSTLAGFDSGGNADNISIGDGLELSGSILSSNITGTINVYDSGVLEGTVRNLDFTDNIFVELDGDTATILVSGTSGGGIETGTVNVYDDNAFITEARGLSFNNDLDVSVTGSIAYISSTATGGASGTFDHTELNNLGWEASNHTGSATSLAGFDSGFIADIINVGAGLELSGSILSVTGTLGGGTSNHAELTNLGWENSGHTGTALNLAGFGSSGNADDISLGNGIKLLGSSLSVDEADDFNWMGDHTISGTFKVYAPETSTAIYLQSTDSINDKQAFMLVRNNFINMGVGDVGFSTRSASISLNSSLGLITLGDGDVKVEGDIYTDAWQSYTPDTVTGWSSTTVEEYRYLRIGNRVFLRFLVSGTSDSTSTSFTLPITPTTDGMDVRVPLRLQDNGTYDMGFAFVDGGNDTLEFRRNTVGNTWTASGDKRIEGELWYIAA